MLKTKKTYKNGYTLVFLLCFVTAFIMLLPLVVVDLGFFKYSGDYNSQIIPFYTYAVDVIRSGGESFSWATDLGSGFLNSYSFYLLGTPFFWLMCLFPASFVPYLLAPILCLKFAFAGLGAYTYIKRYIDDKFSILAALLYTFSGFAIYNIFFYFFIEPIIYFPFLLWSMDEFFYNKKRSFFAIMVALCLLNNYFFFVGQVVFCVIYFIIKLVTKEYKTSVKEFLLFVFEGIIGALIAMCLFLPSVLQILQNPRVANFKEGMGIVMYSEVQQYFAIASSVFLTPDPPYLLNIYTKGAIKWTSMSAYLPLFSFTGVLCYLKNIKNTVFSKIMYVCFVMAFVPILNSSFYAFNSSYYARWYYMPLLFMAGATVIALKDCTAIQIKKATITTAIITIIHLVFAILPHSVTDDETKEVSKVFGVVEDYARLFLTVVTVLLGLLLLWIVITKFKGKENYLKVLCAFTMGFIVLYGLIHLSLCKFPQWDNDAKLKAQVYDDKQNIKMVLPDNEFYRIDEYECYQNLGTHFDIPSIRFFSSTVNPNIMEFYPSVDVKRDVSSKPEHKKYALRGLLSVKYTLMPHDEVEDFLEIDGTQGFMPMYNTKEYSILENQNFVPIGFTYDYYITKEQFEDVYKASRAQVLMRAILLSEEQIEKYGDNLQPIPDDLLNNFNYDSFVIDCDNLRQDSASEFIANKNGFTAKINLEKNNLVFFSIPYDKGFSAIVNGKEATIEKVSNGLVAISCNQGENDIQLTYKAQGFTEGVVLFTVGCIILGIYIIINKIKKGAKQNGYSTDSSERI